MPADLEAKIQRLHSLWQELTGLRVLLTLSRMSVWEFWLAHIGRANAAAGWQLTADAALRALVSYRRRKYAEKPRILQATLAFQHLVGQVEYAEEDLAAAMAERRATRPKATQRREQAVREFTGRPAAEDGRDSAAAQEARIPLSAVLAAMREAVKQAGAPDSRPARTETSRTGVRRSDA